jgi:glucosamine--fructose-6-phosphate aminotransferase (isomerizing)
MCGIVGYLGSSQAAPVLLSSLRCLEYRGYDSAGVAIIENGELAVLKAAGKLSNLESLLNTKQPQATVGIGHTRWATHGVPNDQNAHPHTDCTGTLAIVHNGIIENYQSLRQELSDNGHTFESDTDTEVVSHLIEDEFRGSGDMLTAIRGAVRRLEGAYALGVVSQIFPEKIYAVNHHYSLAVGLGENESYLASDSVAVRQYTNKILRLEQSEIAEISTEGVKLYAFDGTTVNRSPVEVDSNPYVIDKEGHKHFLHKEIHEQPLIMRQTLGKYLHHPEKPVDFSAANGSGHHCGDSSYGVHLSKEDLKKVRRIFIVACGTAYHAGLVGKYVLEELCGIPVEVEIASEMRGRNLLVNGETLTVAVSQSGETADTLAAITEAKSKGSMTLGITNRPDSHLAQITPNLIVTECGIEVSVAATKTFVAQCACFYLLALHIAEELGTIPAARILEIKAQLLAIPALQEQILAREDVVRLKSLRHAEAHDVVFIGRGMNYPIALEGALKLKELSYIHASGYAAGELKHGPIAVLDRNVPVITVLVPGAVYEKTLSNAQEARARNAQMIAVAIDGDEQATKIFDTILRIPPVDEFLSPLLTVIPLQLLSYFIADYLGKDVDQPRNLAKSVTVE